MVHTVMKYVVIEMMNRVMSMADSVLEVSYTRGLYKQSIEKGYQGWLGVIVF